MPPPGLAEKCKRTLDDPCLGRRLADGRSDHCLTGQEDGVTNSANDRSSSMWKWEWMDDQTMWTRSCLIKTLCYDAGNQHLITGSSHIRHTAIIQLLR
uniref:Uncharacterized protein n=2 Tax=Oryza TaxID=4527 RepID=A0A0E0PHX8_ORYRU